MSQETQITETATVASPDFPGREIDDVRAESNRLTRRALLRIALYGAGIGGGLWAFDKYAPEEDGVKSAFRRAFRFNEGVARSVFFSPDHRAQEFRRSLAVEPRANGMYGRQEFNADFWMLTLQGTSAAAATITLADIKLLPEVSQTTEFKCIEGWSAIVNWTGVRLADFVAKYPPPGPMKYMALAAEPGVDGADSYYVGLDWESAVHPQTILAYAMNGMPLTVDHGAPIRLVIPHKYGVKNIKWITRIAYTNTRPADYWAELGYDWYVGL